MIGNRCGYRSDDFYDVLWELARVHELETSKLKAASRFIGKSCITDAWEFPRGKKGGASDCEAKPAMDRILCASVKHTMLGHPPGCLGSEQIEDVGHPLDVEDLGNVTSEPAPLPPDDPCMLHFCEVLPSEVRTHSETSTAWCDSETGRPSTVVTDIEPNEEKTRKSKVSFESGGSSKTKEDLPQNVPDGAYHMARRFSKRAESDDTRPGDAKNEDIEEETRSSWWADRLVTECFAVSEWISGLEEPIRRGKAATLLFNDHFGTVSIIVILCHACHMAYTSNVAMAEYTANHSRKLSNTIIEIAFLTFYTCEVMLKLYVHRIFFFVSKEKAWNIFDLILVMQGICDELMYWALRNDKETGNVTILRLLRLLKLGKVLRTLRAIAFFKELRVLLLSIVGSINALFWSFCMISILLFNFSLIFVQLVSSHVAAHHATMDDTQRQAAVQYFGSVQLSALTLYKCTNGGLDWEVVYGVLETVGSFTCALFIFFMVFFNFSVMNIVVGVMLEQVANHNLPSREAQMMKKAREHDLLCKELEELLYELDEHGAGTLTWDEFETKAAHDDVRLYLKLLGIELRDAQLFFRILERAQSSKHLGIGDIARYCTRMKGVATGLELQSLAFQVSLVQKTLDQVTELVGGQSRQTTRHLSKKGSSRSKSREGFKAKSVILQSVMKMRGTDLGRRITR